MSIIEIAENIFSIYGNKINMTGILKFFHREFEESLKALKALKEKNMEYENLKKLRQKILIFGKDIFNAPEINLRKYEESIKVDMKALEERLEELKTLEGEN